MFSAARPVASAALAAAAVHASTAWEAASAAAARLAIAAEEEVAPKLGAEKADVEALAVRQISVVQAAGGEQEH